MGDEKDILKTLFINQHVISLKKDTDNITGLSNGTGKVQLRCKDKLQSNLLLQSLASKGIKYSVES